jgi:hypothetical protein
MFARKRLHQYCSSNNISIKLGAATLIFLAVGISRRLAADTAYSPATGSTAFLMEAFSFISYKVNRRFICKPT